MTKKLRYNIMAIMTILLSLTLIIIIVAINLLSYNKIAQEEDHVLEYCLSSQNHGRLPRDGEPDDHNGQPGIPGDQPAPQENKAPSAPPNTNSENSPAPFNGSSENSPAPFDKNSEDTPAPFNGSSENSPAPFAENSEDTPAPSNENPNDASGTDNTQNFEYRPMLNDAAPNSVAKVANSYSLIYVRCNQSGTIDLIQSNHSTNYTKEQLQEYCTQIIQNDTQKGVLDNLKYKKIDTQKGCEIVFLNLTNARSNHKSLFVYSILLGIIGIFVFTGISYLISSMMIKLVETAFTKQEEFIAAASHELKTPLTVIQANSEIVEDQFGKSKWLTYIQTECDRMNQLISSLLTLAKLEQSTEQNEAMYECNLSEAFLERILPFESIAFEKNYTFTYDIPPDILLPGVREQLQQVLTTMVDNAFYHTTPNGHIGITLSQNNRTITLTVSNTGKAIPPEEQERLFQRFYRSDKSRSREDGHFGLGLSIAKAIVEHHNGTIKIHCENGTTNFITTFRKQ